MSTFDFSTQSGTNTQVTIPINSLAYDSFRADFDSTSNFDNITLIENPIVSGDGGSAILTIAAPDVDRIQDCQFRIVGIKGTDETVLWTGSIDYVKSATSGAPSVNPVPAVPTLCTYVFVNPTNATIGTRIPVTALWGSGGFQTVNYYAIAYVPSPTATGQVVNVGSNTDFEPSLLPDHAELVLIPEGAALASGQTVVILGIGF